MVQTQDGMVLSEQARCSSPRSTSMGWNGPSETRVLRAGRSEQRFRRNQLYAGGSNRATGRTGHVGQQQIGADIPGLVAQAHGPHDPPGGALRLPG